MNTKQLETRKRKVRKLNLIPGIESVESSYMFRVFGKMINTAIKISLHKFNGLILDQDDRAGLIHDSIIYILDHNIDVDSIDGLTVIKLSRYLSKIIYTVIVNTSGGIDIDTELSSYVVEDDFNTDSKKIEYSDILERMLVYFNSSKDTTNKRLLRMVEKYSRIVYLKTLTDDNKETAKIMGLTPGNMDVIRHRMIRLIEGITYSNEHSFYNLDDNLNG